MLHKLLRRVQDEWRGAVRSFRYNAPSFQKHHWGEELQRYDWDGSRLYGYDWGDPERADDRLGNYRALRDQLLGFVTPESVVLEIGSLGGKWTQYVRHARQVICVDVTDVGFAYIRKKLPSENISFYLTEGDELRGIASGTVDVLFSMDTLVRVPRSYIARYIAESARVVKAGGHLLMHLPCSDVAFCRQKGFTRLSRRRIERLFAAQTFRSVTIDANLLAHGVVVHAVR